MLMNMIFILTSLLVLISISFSTLFERKIIANFNLRWGPNKSIYYGLMIPFSDFIKLISKSFMKANYYNFFYFYVFWGLIIFFFMFLIYPLNNCMISFEYSFLLFIIFYSIMIYMFFLLGWSSNSKYSIISSYRILIQTVSYEVGFVFSFLILIFMWKSMNFFFLMNFNYMYMSNMIFFLIFFMFLISESSRSPFDMIEGESELVSGFNTEYYSNMFSFIFMIEYGLMLIMSMIFSYFFFGKFSLIFFLMMFYMFCFIRCLFPRFRYDKMMILFWKDLLFMILYLFTFMIKFFN